MTSIETNRNGMDDMLILFNVCWNFMSVRRLLHDTIRCISELCVRVSEDVVRMRPTLFQRIVIVSQSQIKRKDMKYTERCHTPWNCFSL